MPNFLEPKLHGLDWACMPYMFGKYMAPGGEVRIREEMVASVPIETLAAIQLEEVMMNDGRFSTHQRTANT